LTGWNGPECDCKPGMALQLRFAAMQQRGKEYVMQDGTASSVIYIVYRPKMTQRVTTAVIQRRALRSVCQTGSGRTVMCTAHHKTKPLDGQSALLITRWYARETGTTLIVRCTASLVMITRFTTHVIKKLVKRFATPGGMGIIVALTAFLVIMIGLDILIATQMVTSSAIHFGTVKSARCIVNHRITLKGTTAVGILMAHVCASRTGLGQSVWRFAKKETTI
jgi:hypothetical protein